MRISLFLLLLAVCYANVENPNFIYYSSLGGKPYTVSYDKRSFFINNERTIFLAGAIHYPRATQEMWDNVLDQAVSNGLNLIQIYTFWNYHEPVEGQFNWEGRADLRLFLEKCKQRGLFVNLRIGPYVCAEWDNGGIPSWLQYKEGIRYRASNEVWEKYMEQWMRLLIEEVRDYFNDHGGPICMAQIENELTNGDKEYIDWCGKLAMELKADIPWMMCNGDVADETINSCNGVDCSGFLEKGGKTGRILRDQPGIWTENEGWFQVWGQKNPDREGYYARDCRTAENYALSVLRFFSRGGTYHNYYMWFGGNHYGHSAGSGMPTWYTDGVLLRSDTLPNEPKLSHLTNMHHILASVADIIVNDDAQYANKTIIENNIDYFVYKYNDKSVTFIENPSDKIVNATYNNIVYTFKAKQMYLINEKNEILFDTHQYEQAKTIRKTTPIKKLNFKYWNEPIQTMKSTNFPPVILPKASEQINITRDLTEYLYYQTQYTFTQENNTLTIGGSSSNAYVFLIDGIKISTTDEHTHSGGWHTYTMNFVTSIGEHTLTLLSESLGIHNIMNSNSQPLKDGDRLKGICGWIKMNGISFFDQEWYHWNGLYGEYLEIYTDEGAKKVEWKEDIENHASITWFTDTFDTPTDLKRGIEVLFHPLGLQRGHAFINGNDIGKYWMIKAPDDDYSQDYYHIPKDWLRYDGVPNTITISEVFGADEVDKAEICITQLVPK